MDPNGINVPFSLEDDFKKELGEFRKEVNKSSSFLKQSMTTAVGFAAGQISMKLTGAMAAIPGKIYRQIDDFRKKASSAAASEEMAFSKMEQVILSTGGAAGFTTVQLEKMANAFRKNSTFTNAQVMDAEALIATFTQIKGDVFPDTIQATLDMAQMFGGLEQSSIRLGKALNDPIIGVSALREVGVSFSQEQIEVIKNLANTGRVAEAQRLILKELNTEFGGQAEKATRTFLGGEQQKQNAWEHTYAIAGKVLNEALKPLNKELASLAESEGVVDIFNRIGSAMAAPVKSVTELFKKVRLTVDFIGDLKKMNREGLLGEDEFVQTSDAVIDYIKGNVKLLFKETAEIMWDNMKPMTMRLLDLLKMGIAETFEHIPGLGGSADSLRKMTAEYQARQKVYSNAYETPFSAAALSPGQARIAGQQAGRNVADMQIGLKQGKYYEQYLEELKALRGENADAEAKRDQERSERYQKERDAIRDALQDKIAPLLEDNPALKTLVDEYMKGLNKIETETSRAGKESEASKGENKFSNAVTDFGKAVDKFKGEGAMTSGSRKIAERYERRAEGAYRAGDEEEANRLMEIAKRRRMGQKAYEKSKSGESGSSADQAAKAAEDTGTAMDKITESVVKIAKHVQESQRKIDEVAGAIA